MTGVQTCALPIYHIFLWRVIANDSANELTDLVPEIADVNSVTPPRPSDLRILGTSGANAWASASLLSTPRHILEAAGNIGATPRSVARRLTELGIDGIDIDRYPDDRLRSYETDLALLTQFGHPRTDPVATRELSDFAAKHGISTAEAVDILSTYGLAVDSTPEAGKRTCESLAELVLIAHRHGFTLHELTDEVLPDWLHSDGRALLEGIADIHAPIPLGHVLDKSARLNLSIDEIVDRLRTMGLAAPDLPATVSVDDAELLSVNLNGVGPWLDVRKPVRLHYLIKAHAVLNQSPFWAADRLSQLGFTVQTENLPYYPEYRDLTLLREDFSGGFLDPEQPVPLARLVALSRQLSSPLNQIVGRLRELGMNVPDLATTIRNALAKVPLER